MSSVVIVGAGPAGMALAYLLARRGVGVTVLESQPDFARAFRGEGLQPSGVDAFRQMGLGDQLERLPHRRLDVLEIYQGGRLRIRARPEQVGAGEARLFSQPAVLGMLAAEAARLPSFRLEMRVTVREVVHEEGRAVGVRADAAGKPTVYRADFVVGADGRHAVTRKQGSFQELTSPQDFDLLWVKTPLPASYPGLGTARIEVDKGRFTVVFPTADGQLQVGFVIPKGGFAALRARGEAAWTDELIGRLQPDLAEHFRAHHAALAHPSLLNVVCGRLTTWTAPGLLLLGDAAHPMSPVGGQGINVALRDALVAANHLCPVLTAKGGPAVIDAAAQQVQVERMPEIVSVQEAQTRQARFLLEAHRWRVRLFHRLLPIIVRTGWLPRLFRGHFDRLTHGVTSVRLTV